MAVDPATGDMSVFADGFTNIIDLEFGPDGSLYVVQISSSSLLFDELDGAVIKVAPDGSRSVFYDALFAPTGIAIDQVSGDVYVSNCGICPGFGEVIRIDGEPASPISLAYSASNDRAAPQPPTTDGIYARSGRFRRRTRAAQPIRTPAPGRFRRSTTPGSRRLPRPR